MVWGRYGLVGQEHAGNRRSCSAGSAPGGRSRVRTHSLSVSALAGKVLDETPGFSKIVRVKTLVELMIDLGQRLLRGL